MTKEEAYTQMSSLLGEDFCFDVMCAHFINGQGTEKEHAELLRKIKTNDKYAEFKKIMLEYLKSE